MFGIFEFDDLFGVKLSDYHNRMERASSRSSAIINYDAINRRRFFSCQNGVRMCLLGLLQNELLNIMFFRACQP